MSPFLSLIQSSPHHRENPTPLARKLIPNPRQTQHRNSSQTIHPPPKPKSTQPSTTQPTTDPPKTFQSPPTNPPPWHHPDLPHLPHQTYELHQPMRPTEAWFKEKGLIQGERERERERMKRKINQRGKMWKIRGNA